MLEYGIYNGIITEVIYGYNFIDACKRHNLNPAEWEVEYIEFID